MNFSWMKSSFVRDELMELWWIYDGLHGWMWWNWMSMRIESRRLEALKQSTHPTILVGCYYDWSSNCHHITHATFWQGHVASQFTLCFWPVIFITITPISPKAIGHLLQLVRVACRCKVSCSAIRLGLSSSVISFSFKNCMMLPYFIYF